MIESRDQTFNSALNCLLHNDNIQKLIGDTVCHIDNSIASLKDLEEYLLSQVKKEDDVRSSYLTQFINGQNERVVRRPYFMSVTGLTPPANEAQTNRKQKCVFDVYEIKRQIQRICSEKQLETLKTSIGQYVYDIEYNRLKRSKDKSAIKEICKLSSTDFKELSERCKGEMLDRIDWLEISVKKLNSEISPEDCRQIWDQSFNPEYDYSKFTDEENTILLRLVAEYGCQGKWIEISSKMKQKRKPYLCYRTWLELTSKMETTKAWTAEEDVMLKEMIEKTAEKVLSNSAVNWNKVALMMSGRSAVDCEKRWNSLQSEVFARPFTDEEDFQLLLLIKRMGAESWSDIARQMNQRNRERCQLRYCQLVDEFQPWDYLEDRRLWIYLRPNLRAVWHDNFQADNIRENLDIYKNLVKMFSCRGAIVLRHRYMKLIKWFKLWDQFYQTLSMSMRTSHDDDGEQVTTLLSDSCPEKDAVLSVIRNIILKTSFFDCLCDAFRENGSVNPVDDANQLMDCCKQGHVDEMKKFFDSSVNKTLLEFRLFIVDLQNGIFIPRKFGNFIKRPNLGLKYPNNVENDLRVTKTNVRKLESKSILEKSLRREIAQLLEDENVREKDKNIMRILLENDGKFMAAMNYAGDTLEKDGKHMLCFKADKLEKILPGILKRMLHYYYREETTSLIRKNLVFRTTNPHADKREQLAELLIFRDNIPRMYKTYLDSKTSIFGKFLPGPIHAAVCKSQSTENSSKRIAKLLRSLQHFPVADRDQAWFSSYSNAEGVPILSPNRCTLHLLRAFYLQREKLCEKGSSEFIRLNRLKYDTRIPIEGGVLDKIEQPDKCQAELFSPMFHLLRWRLLSLLAIPSVVATMSPHACISQADKLHEVQNGVQKSTLISDSFSIHSIVNISTLPSSSSASFRTRFRKRKHVLDVFDNFELTGQALDSDRIELASSLNKSNAPMTTTRRLRSKWLEIYLPNLGRSVYISQDLFIPMVKKNFCIYSICGKGSHDLDNKL